MTGTRGTWLPALAGARARTRAANVLWLGDSLSELDPAFDPMPWFVGRVLSAWTEQVQYRNAGAEFTPSMSTTGTASPDEHAGFGGRSVDLEPGQSSSVAGAGEGVSVLWTRQAGGGVLDVEWGGARLGTIDTDGPLRYSQRTVFPRPTGDGADVADASDVLTVTARGAAARLEGVYLHTQNLDQGVRVWPAVRSGNTTQDFLDHPGWGLDALDTLAPDLVVIATGTNADTGYAGELDALIDALRARSGADIAVWLPYINSSFTLEEAAEGRAVAEARQCRLVDAAAVLGVPPTVDGAHPSSVGTALAGAHAAAVLSGDPVATAALIAGQAAASVGGGQIWRPGGGSISIENPVGSSVLSGRGDPDDLGHQWAILLTSLAAGLFGLSGPTFSFGPGGDRPIDTHVSRAGPGRVAINGGSGQVDLARVRVAVDEQSGEDQQPGADQPSGQPGAVEGAAVLYARNRRGSTELAVRLPDGSGHVLAPAPRAGYRAPVPCALSPAHRRAPRGLALPPGRVFWVPFPVLELAAVATHVWIEVEEPCGPVTAMAAVVSTAADGRPGDVVASTGAAAIDLSMAGVRGAALEAPALLAAGEPWWVALSVPTGGDGSPVVGAAEGLEGGPAAQLGSAPVMPSTGRASGALVLDGQVAVPARPGVDLVHLVGPLPVLHVSLEAP